MFFVVTGGSGSGKSAFAEKLTASLGEGRRIYIATMMCFDEEGKKRISRHRAMRADKHFETLERYTDLCGLEVPEDSILLLECMSNLVANEMFDESGAKEGTVEAVMEGLHHLRKKAHGIAHALLRPVRTGHGDLGIHGKCDKKAANQIHNRYSPFLTSGSP